MALFHMSDLYPHPTLQLEVLVDLIKSSLAFFLSAYGTFQVVLEGCNSSL